MKLASRMAALKPLLTQNEEKEAGCLQKVQEPDCSRLGGCDCSLNNVMNAGKSLYSVLVINLKKMLLIRCR
jgi:hypothetical protein